MEKRSSSLILTDLTTGIFLLILLAGCSLLPQAPTPSPQDDFPLLPGTTWTYQRTEYQASAADPAVILRATYQLVETVSDVQAQRPYIVAHVQGTKKQLRADAGWPEVDLSGGQPLEFWYLVQDGNVYETAELPSLASLNPAALTLAYRLPLTPGDKWCPNPAQKDEAGMAVQSTPEPGLLPCEYGGKRTVGSLEALQTAAGNFERCHRIVDFYNSGALIQWFCAGVGKTAQKYDHNGSAFGFEEIILEYKKGTH